MQCEQFDIIIIWAVAVTFFGLPQFTLVCVLLSF